EFAKRLGNLIARSAQSGAAPNSAHSGIGIAATIYFGAAGFLAMYLLMRLCIQMMIARIEAPLTTGDGVAALLSAARAEEEEHRRRVGLRAVAEAEKLGGIAQVRSDRRSAQWSDFIPMVAALGTAAVPTLLSEYRSKRVTPSADDPNKGRFGGKASDAD